MARHILANIYLFNQLNEDELTEIESIAETVKFNARDRIFRQGDTADSLYVIKYGSVQIQYDSPNMDSSMVVRTHGSGSHFGEMSLIDGEKRSGGANVLEPSEIVVIRYPKLLRLLDEHPNIAVIFYRSLARHLSGRLRQTTTDLGFARDRVLHPL